MFDGRHISKSSQVTVPSFRYINHIACRAPVSGALCACLTSYAVQLHVSLYYCAKNQTFKTKTLLEGLKKNKNVHFTCDIMLYTRFLITFLPDELLSASCTFIMFLQYYLKL